MGGERSRRGGARRRRSGDRRAGGAVVALRAPRRGAGAFRDGLEPRPRPALAQDRSRRRDRRDREVVAPLVGRQHLPRPLARRRAALAHHAQEPHLRSDRRDRGGADHLAARADRRRAELGLPLLLAARRHVHALRAHDRGLQARGAGLAGLVAARRRRRSAARADPLRPGGRAPPHRADARLAPRLRGLPAGAHRQRRQQSVSARRLRRGDRLPLPGPARRAAGPATRPGRSSAGWSTSSSRSGRPRTKGSGRCGARGATSPTAR